MRNVRSLIWNVVREDFEEGNQEDPDLSEDGEEESEKLEIEYLDEDDFPDEEE